MLKDDIIVALDDTTKLQIKQNAENATTNTLAIPLDIKLLPIIRPAAKITVDDIVDLACLKHIK